MPKEAVSLVSAQLAQYFPRPHPTAAPPCRLVSLSGTPEAERGAVSPGIGSKGAAGSVVHLKTVINPTNRWPAFYYHHMHTILNNASGKTKQPSRPTTPSRSGTDGLVKYSFPTVQTAQAEGSSQRREGGLATGSEEPF